MNLKRTTALCLCGVIFASMLVGCGSGNNTADSGSAAASTNEDSKGHITFIMNRRDEFLSTLEEAAIQITKDKGYEMDTQDAQSDGAKQIQYIETAVNGGSDAIIVTPVDVEACQSLVDAAGGTPLVLVNCPPSDLHVVAADNVAFVGSDEDTSGRFQGEYLAEYFKAQGKTEISYVMFQGLLGQVSTSKRSNGALEALEENGIKATASIAPIAAEYDRAEAMDKMLTVLSGGTKFDCIIANNDAMALGVVEACEDQGVDPTTFPIVGIDCTADGANAIVDGKMAMTVFQDPEGQGEGAIMACINMIENKPINTGTEYELDDSSEDYSDHVIWVPFEPVTADNVADYM